MNGLKYFLLLFLLAACSGIRPTLSLDILEAKDVNPVGRTKLSDNRLELISSAAHFGFTFSGSICSVHVRIPDWLSHNYIQYTINGELHRKRVSRENEWITIKGREDGMNEVWFYKATEAHTGAVYVHEIKAAAVRTLEEPALPMIEFIGNSITCGAAADDSEVKCGTDVYHDQHNAFLAYGPRVARELNLSYMLSSVSGIGIYRNWNSNGPDMPSVYDKTDFRPEGPQWDFGKYSPAIISIALGTNDMSNGDGKTQRQPFDSSVFIHDYVKFILQVQSIYPSSKIALLSSPMMQGERREMLNQCLVEIKNKTELLTGRPVYLHLFKPMQAKGCTGHPSVEDHAVMAGELVPFFKRIMDQQAPLVDDKATVETKALHKNLWVLSKDHTLFGHQHATEYGHGWYGDENRSDVKSVTGSHPAVIGIDFGGFSGTSEQNIKRNMSVQKKIVEDTYNRGGVITAAWHFLNPVSGGGFYWVDTISKPAVRYIIPGGDAHDKYKSILQDLAAWAKSCKGNDGKQVPMIFRPFHEFDGDWFWWGKSHSTREEFIALWRFTVSYLRDSLDVHNFIYAFSPDNRFNSEEEFLDRYPGDAWVDMVGLDNYGDMGRYGSYNLDAAIKKLQIVDAYAKKSGKLAAFTETGLESIVNPEWWTGSLLKVMKSGNMNISYVLVWRNDRQSPTHYYAPFPGHPSVPDFMRFFNDPYTLFENDLKGIYELRP